MAQAVVRVWVGVGVGLGWWVLVRVWEWVLVVLWWSVLPVRWWQGWRLCCDDGCGGGACVWGWRVGGTRRVRGTRREGGGCG